ncbi:MULTISPECIES: cytochrome c [Burkholderiales]|uniref:SorU family sulfite dehydrogenase c-type cytochrome subunit n=1 Tax=Burkholderiales TaxID=80840 RepID=UPI0006FAA6AE|nr:MULTISPECIES: cytochrome c [Burkholderiales]KQW51228.1 sulfide dehydrogenase [Pelomonas sp. Root405]KRA77460.1 sulfide dehydrogenase [Pelomonas sp. Root662]MBK6616066.1 cytochrome c [Ottowia sp.]
MRNTIHQHFVVHALKVASVLVAGLALPALPALAADESAQLVLGKKLFLQGVVPSCAVCHTLQAAGAEGAVGPVLDELKPDAGRVAKALRNGLGQMPSYKDKLTDAEIAALALYVSKASGGAK